MTEPLTLRHKTDFYSVSPDYWDSSGMNMSNDPKIIYGTIPNTNIHTILSGTGFFVEESHLNDPEVDSFVNTTLNKFPISKQDKYKNLIHKGETELVEFKATFKWDINEKRVNKDLPEEVTQALCAFSNSRGGTLFIGVKDDKSIYGLKNDLKILKDIDKFQQEVAKKIREDLGGGINYKMDIEEIHNKQICVIKDETSDVPVFLKNKEYYVRRGTSNHKCNAKETYEHIRNHYGIYQESIINDDEEPYREIKVDIELIKNYIEMLEKGVIPHSRFQKRYSVIKNECFRISVRRELDEKILNCVSLISEYFWSVINNKDKELLKIILESLELFAKKPKLFEILKKKCDLNKLIALFERGNRDSNLVSILFEFGYFSDIVLRIMNALEEKDIKLVNELTITVWREHLQNEKNELLKLLNKKINEYDSEKDKRITKFVEKLISNLESKRGIWTTPEY